MNEIIRKRVLEVAEANGDDVLLEVEAVDELTAAGVDIKAFYEANPDDRFAPSVLKRLFLPEERIDKRPTLVFKNIEECIEYDRYLNDPHHPHRIYGGILYNGIYKKYDDMICDQLSAAQFECKYCGEDEDSLALLENCYCEYSPKRKHVRFYAPKSEKYLCEWCGFEADSIGYMTIRYCGQSPTRHHVAADGHKLELDRYFCKYCGGKFSDIKTLLQGGCMKSPINKHIAYNGMERDVYVCKSCGEGFDSIKNLVSAPCENNRKKIHILYDGLESSRYYCKICGEVSDTIKDLTSGICKNSPTGKHILEM